MSYFAVLALYLSSLGPGFVVGKRVKAQRAKQTEWWTGEGKRAVEPSPDYHSASPLRFFFITSPPPPTAESVPGYTKVTYILFSSKIGFEYPGYQRLFMLYIFQFHQVFIVTCIKTSPLMALSCGQDQGNPPQKKPLVSSFKLKRP